MVPVTLMADRRVTKTKLIFGFLFVGYFSIACTYAADTLFVNQTIRYNKTIVSPQETFELGFFSPTNSTNHYVGIWYKKIPKRTVVWVANRDAPLIDTSGELTLTLQGVLVLQDATTGNILWSSAKSSRTSVMNPIGQLLDTGNFLIYEEGDQENPIWQSFDFLTDTFLPEMKYGWNLVTGVEWRLTSWKSNPVYNFTFVLNQREIYYRNELINTSVSMRLVLQPDGRMERFLWTDSKQEWNLYQALSSDNCDRYALCGPFGSCNIDNSQVCECLKGFEPRSPEQWRGGNWSQGCRRTIPLDCGPEEGFNKYSNLKLPDTQGSWYNQTMTLVDCEKMCKSNCSCTAYTNSNISVTGSGCLLWFGELIDIRTFAENGDSLYIRMPPSELGTPKNEFEHDLENRSGDEDVELPLFGLSTLLKATDNFSNNNKLGEGGFGPVYKGVLEDGKEIAVKRLANTSTQGLQEFKNEVISISKLQHRNLVKLLGYCIEREEKMLIYEYMPNKGLDSIIFDRTQSELLGWPTRYQIIHGIARGLLYIHQDSRLRIIHRDLKVSNILLDMDMNPKISDFGMARSFGGNQIEANTKRVVGTYGYMAPEYAGNGVFSINSDVYSFGVVVLEIVSGKKNRGFIHKEHYNNLIGHVSSNIHLSIATRKLGSTTAGIFSDRILNHKSGHKCCDWFCLPLSSCDILAWGLYNEGRSLELVAKSLGESINVSQVLRSIHVGLLCVQHHPKDRPTMTSVILMLGSDRSLPSPKEPGFYVGECTQDSAHSYGISSNNELSISMLDGR
ncbi:putative protein kinase RLK-Pelle-DLSV family [Helianthus annuus]|nr:putative protein kinase RLK-Pelle-DLSV family [Helianthus annuus]